MSDQVIVILGILLRAAAQLQHVFYGSYHPTLQSASDEWQRHEFDRHIARFAASLR